MKKDSRKRIKELLSKDYNYQNTPEIEDATKVEVLRRIGYPADETELQRSGQPLRMHDDFTYKCGFCEEAVECFL